ncbi:hypothetical protein PN499_11645 [Kamptonema animale CS-326]|jgi:hypothetical protein|uniref:hypothetical protein n=1 Tax=Kamptonema animale TaxID=92934 RepID=UPI00232E3864|nr:hypothetical protein [Kamptonema animale]MDB9511840.1 hypothetical protein [Kamptonema animale CS-326]
MLFNFRVWLKTGGILSAAIAAVIVVPVFAEETANFGTLTLSRGFQPPTAVLRGSTGGSYSLSAIANSDLHKNKCLGFAAPTPDHILILQQDFSRLTIAIDTGGKDTTLLISGPNSTIHCGDDTGQSKDASIVDSGWKAGTYRIWVGTIESGSKYKYTLSVQE